MSIETDDKNDAKKQARAIASRQSQQARTESHMQQLLHGIRLAASDELTRADELERMAQLIEDLSSDDRRHRNRLFNPRVAGL